MRQLMIVSWLVVGCALAGCATLSESQCLASDWQTIGYRDGMNGTHQSQLLKHQNACVKHGVTPDRTAYMEGWNTGVAQYCQPNNGFTVGEQGSAYPNVCPEALQSAYYAAYQDGRRLYLAQAEINNLQRAINDNLERLAHLTRDLSNTEALLVEGDLTPVQRRELLDETKALAREQGELENQTQELRIDAAVKQERLRNLRIELAYATY
ncbi:MAG: DUF2799 domain-containing protein [Gammaproteobacteria bacterium]|nr:DUF2799 domain-containing protein [Gammaproteobacteria bacterium]